VAELTSIGDDVEEGTYTVHSRFRRAVNLTDGDRLITLVTPDLGAGPRNLVVRGLELERVVGLRVDASGVEIGSRRFAIGGRTYDSSIDLSGACLDALRDGLGTLRACLVALAPPGSLAFLLDEGRLRGLRPGFETAFARHVRACARDIFTSDLLRGVSRLAGAGVGLTPSGDDFICGLLLGAAILETLGAGDLGSIRKAVFEAARRGDVLADTNLALARDGLVGERVRDLILALAAGDRRAVRGAAIRVFAIGHTSGADLVTGLFMTLDTGIRRAIGRTASAAQRHGGALWS
jgi:hypothetical protein